MPEPTRLTADEQAAVLAENERAVWWLAHWSCPRATESEIEEVADEVRFWFARAAQTFDPTRGKSFLTYARRTAQFKARYCFRKMRRCGIHVTISREYQSRPRIGVSSLSDRPAGCEWSGEYGDDSLAALADEGEDLRLDTDAIWAGLRRHLDERSARAVEMHFREGVDQTGIAAALGVRRGVVQRLIARAVARLRERGYCAAYRQAG